MISIDSDDDAAPAPAAAPAREGVIEIIRTRTTTQLSCATGHHGRHRPDARQRRRGPAQAPATTGAASASARHGLRARRYRSAPADPSDPQLRRRPGPRRRAALPVGGRGTAPLRVDGPRAARRRTGRRRAKYGRCDPVGRAARAGDRFSPDLWRVINGIRDHVFPELLLPDFALFWSYAIAEAQSRRRRGVQWRGLRAALRLEDYLRRDGRRPECRVARLYWSWSGAPATRWNASANASSATRASRRSASRCPCREEASTSCPAILATSATARGRGSTRSSGRVARRRRRPGTRPASAGP